jgi:hypothetical protein
MRLLTTNQNNRQSGAQEHSKLFQTGPMKR